MTGTPRNGWDPVDLGGVLSGDVLTPQLCRRSDGNSILYDGLVHVLRGSAGSGKTALAGVAAAQLLMMGRPVAWIDMTHTPQTVVGLLQTVGVTGEQIRDQFAYLAPYTLADAQLPPADLIILEADTPVPDEVFAWFHQTTAAWLITGYADDWMRDSDDLLTRRADVHIHCVLHTYGGRRTRYRLLKDRPRQIRVPSGEHPPLADLWIHAGSYQLTPGRETPHEAGSKLEAVALELVRKSPGVGHDQLLGLLGPVAKKDRERLIQRLANEGRIVSQVDDGMRIWFTAGSPALGQEATT